MKMGKERAVNKKRNKRCIFASFSAMIQLRERKRGRTSGGRIWWGL